MASSSAISDDSHIVPLCSPMASSMSAKAASAERAVGHRGRG
jgi:hypothetical protein